MKKLLSVVVLSALPVFVYAGSNHSDEHGHGDSSSQKSAKHEKHASDKGSDKGADMGAMKGNHSKSSHQKSGHDSGHSSHDRGKEKTMGGGKSMSHSDGKEGHGSEGHGKDSHGGSSHGKSGHDKSSMSHDENGPHQAAAGQAGDAAKVTRSVAVGMADSMRFDPAIMKFKVGDTVRFKVKNNGKIRHEMVIGSVAELKEHAEMMRGNAGMKHAEANSISLAPGEQGEVVWQFTQAGNFDFACLVPGHLEAGMAGKIEVL